MNTTQIIVVGVIVGLIAYDVVAGKLGQPTESSVLRDWALNWTILPFIAGFLMAHWFAPRTHADVSGWMWALPAMGVVLGMDVLWHFLGAGLRPWWRYPMLYGLLGTPCGFYLWPQPF